MGYGSRRGFMKAVSGTAAALAISRNVPAWAGMSVDRVRVWSSFREKRHAEGEGLSWKTGGAIAADAIVLDAGTVKQEILGFGGAMTDASCYLLSQLTEAERGAIMHACLRRKRWASTFAGRAWGRATTRGLCTALTRARSPIRR